MCSTPYCSGECDDCQYEKRMDEEREATSTDCPYRKECELITVDSKTDRCTYCGQTFNY